VQKAAYSITSSARTQRVGRIAETARASPGMRVQVISGPLRDQIGLLGALRPHERVLVLLQLLGEERPVELARRGVVKTPSLP
jgi:transcription antitermination factor NusG